MGTRRAKNQAVALPFVEDSGGLGEVDRCNALPRRFVIQAGGSGLSLSLLRGFLKNPSDGLFSDGGEANLLLGEADGRPALVWARGMDRGDLRRAMTETLAHRGKLLLAWRRVHGAGDETEV